MSFTIGAPVIIIIIIDWWCMELELINVDGSFLEKVGIDPVIKSCVSTKTADVKRHRVD